MYLDNNIIGVINYGAEIEDNEVKDNYTVWVAKDKEIKPYTFAEAMNLTGHGWYNVGLLAVNSLCLLAMSIDMFAFAVIVSGSACDLNIGPVENKVLLSIPFVGTIFAAYPWGYFSDTQGRQKSLLVAMWGSFIAATLSSLSPNWIVMAVLKFIDVSFVGCAQSVTYTLIGESCSEKVKAAYYVILTSILSFSFVICTSSTFLLLSMEFDYDLYFINFTPWRLMAIILALPLGVSAVSLHCFYESPKFLLNIGDEKQALDILRKIWRRNKCIGKYPVQKIVLEEKGNIIYDSSKPLLSSMWEQTIPLFKVPLLLRTLQLFYLAIVIFITTNSVLIWLPFMTNAFVSGMSSSKSQTGQGFCDVISHTHLNETGGEQSCAPKSDPIVALTSLGQGFFLLVVCLGISKLASRRKLLIMLMLGASTLGAVGSASFNILTVGAAMFYLTPICMSISGVPFSYFVDLYPTSYRGMASCLGVMVARIGGLFSVNVIGLYIINDCSYTFYAIAAILISGMIVALFLPPDRPKKT